MKKVKGHFTDKNLVRELADMILEYMDDNTVVFNIGTDRCIGDACGPLVGTFLEKESFSFPVYGTVKYPCHALNLEKRLQEVKVKHPNARLIGIDACLGDSESIGEIQCRDYPIHPGKGVGKNLPQVGEISIIGIVDSSDSNELFTNRTIRLDLIMDLAKVITDALLLAEKEYRSKAKEREIAASF